MAVVRARSMRFDWLMAIAAYWTMIGLYTDLSWHIRHEVDSFFTVQHAILYSGLAALFGSVVIGAVSRVLTQPYRLSIAGVAIFAAGGAADLWKHETFGFERDFDALFSPTHLIIGIGVMIAICLPLRSALTGARPRTLAEQLPALISAAAVLELLHWATNLFFRSDLAPQFGVTLPHQLTSDAVTMQALYMYALGSGLAAFILQALLLTGTALYLVRNFALRFGALTIVFVLGNALVAIGTAVSSTEVLAVLVASIAAGLAADAFVRKGSALYENRLWYGAFAFCVPVAYHVALLAFTAATTGVWWPADIAAGAVLDTGIFGVFLSFAAFACAPPPDDAPA